MFDEEGIMAYQPRFIKEFLPNGDYNLIPNPKCTLLNCKISKRHSIHNSSGLSVFELGKKYLMHPVFKDKSRRNFIKQNRKNKKNKN